MIRFIGEVAGVEVFDRAFNRVDEYISDLRSVWPGFAKEFYMIESEQFESEGATGASGKWPSLSHSYARFKEIAFPGQTTLKATNSLFDSMTSPDANDSIYRPEATELTIGTQREGALAHHRGSPRTNLPQRPIISLTEISKRRLQKAIQLGLVQFVRRQGFTVESDLAA